jgi:heme-degrading monooxygenase HmoA
MFVVIYRFTLQAHQEKIYQQCWDKLTNYFIKQRGAIGSCLHKGDNGLWIAYSRWPDKATRDASWNDAETTRQQFPEAVQNAIETMQKIKMENVDLEQYEEICCEVINDKL